MTNYIGGKYILGVPIAKEVVSIFDENSERDTYIEPFVGMGGVLRRVAMAPPPSLSLVCISNTP